MKKTYCTIIVLITISLLIGFAFYKEPIENVTIDEIQAVRGIGDTLSYRIVNYIGEVETFDIDDLLNVDGIGKKRLKLLRKEFR